MKYKTAKHLASAFVAALILLAPRASAAQGDLRQRLRPDREGDYLASHPDEVFAFVKGYFVQHPEAVGQILVETLKPGLRHDCKHGYHSRHQHQNSC